MKKKLFSLMSLLTVGIMAWASVPAAFCAPDGADGGTADPSLIMGVYLSDPGNAPRRMTVTVTGENEYKIETTSTDSWTHLTALTSDWASNLTAVTFEYKLNVKTDCEFFFGKPFGAYVGGNEQPFVLEAANDWTVCYVDIASWREKLGWGKKGDNLRLDVGNGAGIVMSIRNIQPATTEAYEAYMNSKSDLKPVDGWYMLGTAQDLVKFAALVNNGKPASNAKLTADIDLSEIADWTPIAAASACGYAGVFDGQNHTITNFKKVADKAGAAGLFGYVVNGTVKNLTVYGELNCMGVAGGLIAWTQGATVQNVHSYLNIKCLTADTHHIGGVVGSARDNSVISNCSFHGTLEIGANNTDCFGGITGYTNTAKFVNCANYGEITCDNPNCTCGGILGYVNNAGNPGIQNCYGGGSVKCTKGGEVTVSALVGALRGYNAATILNNYWNENSGVQGSGEHTVATIKKVSNDQVLSGEVCYLLNGNQSNIAFYQKIGTDEVPSLDSSRGQVYVQGDLKCDGTPFDTDTYSNTPYKPVLTPHEYDNNGYCVNCGKAEPAVDPAQDGWYEITTGRELRNISRFVNAGNNQIRIRLMNDIDMDGIAMEPIGTYNDNSPKIAFRGTFDGQNHIIYNLTINVNSGEEAGLFGRINNGGTLKNLGVVNATITNGAAIRAGVLVGECHASNLLNCFTAGNLVINTTHQQKGGIAAEAAATTIVNCYTTYDCIAAAAGGYDRCWAGEDVRNNIESGALAWMMNGNQNTISWYQEIGVDAYPVLNNTKPCVKYVGEAGVATMSNTEAFELNGDVKASIITGADKSNRLIQKDVTVVPANTAVMLEGTYYNVVPATSAADDCTGNMLVAVATEMEAPVGSYVLQKNNDVVGFYRVEAGAQPTIKAGKAYLSVPSAEAKAFFFGGEEGNATAISGVSETTTGAAIYNMAGQRLQKVQKGINIVDGKKIMK